jgi:hypothetical protein
MREEKELVSSPRHCANLFPRRVKSCETPTVTGIVSRGISCASRALFPREIRPRALPPRPEILRAQKSTRQPASSWWACSLALLLLGEHVAWQRKEIHLFLSAAGGQERRPPPPLVSPCPCRDGAKERDGTSSGRRHSFAAVKPRAGATVHGQQHVPEMMSPSLPSTSESQQTPTMPHLTESQNRSPNLAWYNCLSECLGLRCCELFIWIF